MTLCALADYQGQSTVSAYPLPAETPPPEVLDTGPALTHPLTTAANRDDVVVAHGAVI